MATHSYSVQQSKHATLDAGDVDTVTLEGCHQGIVRVRNRATSGAPIYFRIYSAATASSAQTAPSAAGDNTYVVPFGDLCDVANSLSSVVVKLISADAQAYSVESIMGLN